MSNSERIAKNTIFLYIRMLVLMLVSLYTSRVVLAALGVEDYGVYNVVGGIVVLFTFLNNAMVTSTQRYLNYELGRNDLVQARKVFSSSLNIHLFIALIVFFLAETVGLWFLNSTIRYPESREYAVQVSYQLSIITACVKIIRTPYNAAIIAHERMSFYAYLSIFEGILQLGVAFLLMGCQLDRLIFYSILLCAVAVIVNLSYYAYCRKKFEICQYTLCKDKSLYRQLLSFSGWSLLGGAANVGATQGLNMLLNVFWGVVVNAAMGVAIQVNSAVTSFVHSFQTAFNPQIVKSYAAGDYNYFIKLILATSKYSYLLLFVFVLPIYRCCPEVLSVWLEEVPEYAVSFCRLMLIFALLDALQGPLWYSVQATGKIKTYQILMSFVILANVPIAYVCLKLGCSPNSVLVVRCIINFVTLFIRLWYLNKLYEFPIMRFVYEVILRIVPVTLFSYIISSIPIEATSPLLEIIIITGLTFIANTILILFVGLNKSERGRIKNLYEKCR